MSELRFALAHYAALGALALLGYHLGRTLTRRVPYRSLIEEIAFSTSVGLAAISYVVMALGLAGVLYAPVVACALAGCGIASAPAWIVSMRRLAGWLHRTRWLSLRSVAVLVAVLVSILAFVPLLKWPLYPPTSFDSTMYHLTVSKIYSAAHALVLTPDLRYPVIPQMPHMLFTLALLLYDDIFAQLTQFLALVLLTCAMLAMTRQYLSVRAGWIAVAVLLSCPLVLWLASTAYIDMTVMLFTTLMTGAFWNWSHTRERSWLVMAGVLGGIAVCVKLSAGFFILLFGTAALVARPRPRLRDALTFTAAALAAAAPWLLRSAYYTHNPVYPLLRSSFERLFGSGMVEATAYEELFGDFAMYGFGRSLKALVMLPWNVATDPTAFGSWIPLSISLGLTLPTIAVGLLWSTTVRFLVVVAASYTLFWFVTAQELRYWMPALPLLCVAIAGSMERFLRFRAGRILAPALAVVMLLPGWMYVRARVAEAGSVPRAAHQRDSYLTRHLPSYQAYLVLRTLGRRDYTAYAFDDENLKYYADGRLLGDYFGPARYDVVLPHLSDSAALQDTLKALGANYFIINHQRRHIPIRMDRSFQRRFKTLWTSATVSLFELTEPQPDATPDLELLDNPGFETLINDLPAAWTVVGSPIIDASGGNSATGSVAIRCAGSANVLFQSVSVEADLTYRLRFTAKGTDSKQTARRQVNWLDRERRFLTTTLEVLPVTATWQRYELVATPPDRARYAVVYAACHGNGSAWFDDMSFTEAAAR
jgi:4-amino-4-deoxy-L-arabinose transferase-like glycosyltransferase